MTDVPYSPTAERTVIGAALWSAEVAEMIATEIDPSDFYDTTLSTLAWRIRKATLEGQKVDPAALSVELENLDGHSGRAWGRFLTGLMADSTSSVIGAKRGAVEVVECAARRRVMLACESLRAAAADRSVDLATVMDEARQLAARAELPVTNTTPDPDVNEFLAEQEEQDWLVPGLLERGDRLMVTGEEGKGKSTLLRQFAVCAAAGLGVFGTGTMTPRRVLIIDCENGRAQVRRGLRMLNICARQEGRGIQPGMLRICCRPDGLDLAGKADVRFVHERLQADQPEIVVMGPLYKLVNASPIEEEPAKRVSAVLDTIRARYGVSLIIEAHSPHAQGGAKREMRPYGASLWKRWPEFGIGLVPTDDGVTMEHWRGPREERNWPKALRRGGAWPWTAKDGF